MHVRRVVSMAVFVCVGLAMTAWAQQAGSRSVSMATGDTRVVTSADGLTVVVSVDFGGDGAAPDGIVDEAFRVQLLAPAAFSLAGPATLVYNNDRLTISTAAAPGYTFAVAGKKSSADAVQALGLSHFWGASVHASHDEVAATLLSGTCATTSPATSLSVVPMNMDGCGNCTEGGGPYCSITCNGAGGCSASCSGADSCCSCGGCRCCRY